jgi:c-di-AMP phosphodiesterase-like protein
MLYYRYWDDKFRKRFLHGDVTFTDDEKQYFREQKKEFNDIWKKTKIYDMDGINGAFCTANTMINDICDKILTEKGYDFVFCLNTRSKVVSARSKREDVNLGHIFETMKIGGGHAKSAGIDPRPTTDLSTLLEEITENIIKELKESKGV